MSKPNDFLDIANKALMDGLEKIKPKLKAVHIQKSGEKLPDADKTVVVCLSVQALPIPNRPAVIDHCHDCGCRIWVAETSPKGQKKVCNDCFLKVAEIEEDFILTLNSEQAKLLEEKG